MPTITPASFLSRGAHLRLDGISKSYSDRRVLTDVTFTVSQGECLALIGENGTGKSTLLRIAAGVEPADSGSVEAPGRVGLLWQQPAYALSDSVAQVVEQACAAPLAILREFEKATLALEHAPQGASERYDRALEAATAHDVWNLDHRAQVVLDGVGLAGVSWRRRAGELSGGQRARLSLAWLLLSRPDVLLLDEPTNHLDESGIGFLTSSLANWPGPVLFASHDRAFMDATATGIVDVDPAPQPSALVSSIAGDGPTSGIGVRRYGGTFTDYLQARQDERQRWQKQYETEQAQLRELERSVRDSRMVGHAGAAARTEARSAKKFYADRNASVVCRRVNDFSRRFEQLQRSQVRKPPVELEFQGLSVGAHDGHPVPSVLVALSEAAVADRLEPVSVTVGRSDRLLVTGPNGAGKSTLLGLLTGALQPDSGTVTIARSVTIGVLAQEVELDLGCTVELLYASMVGAQRAEATPLSSFGLVEPRDFSRPVGSLSVGQRRRFALAVVLATRPDLLVLDEPTNHLSLALASAIETHLPDYPGAVVIASHDRWLTRSWTGRRLEL
ncbi:ABC-F family ATP-binding cassette domain-containing protein [Dermatophilus congolensis]|uniref:ABC-F family ATP-binding cassette domain-containing protein n=1 Tax=Dermatophilus congolensis TaxID=1863 RepID=UPI001AAEE9E2|nr:ABC-F family ATP-binding cassette domain-containing protein [Dermatophilus congolensis]MBO3129195.1 ABC-F family ATP-binding cassette domain-containing protein [Dermatophilus congolensis]MBO3132171.1 ABC-F family ATP-binding cassette domain-containing protein [Dermatophilus congolensis]MBO3133673.1 ABC-F family ATP-binding cassette domain-containing protein [Dermatophilus congolensis]MBO3135906.1 ABC-F family ATP-binding cassette domain-containing protein [Dermatophilus congolensis]MBO31381